MIQINNILTIENQRQNITIDSEQEITIVASHLLLLPGLIDPHVHFRTPGLEYKEDWKTAAKASIKGGYTTVFDMPNTLPPTVTQAALEEKKVLIDQQLKEAKIPLRYHLFFGADKHHLNEIKKVKDQVIGIKVFMGCSTGGLVIDDDESLHAIFKIAAEENMLVAVHAEDERRLKENEKKFTGLQNYSIHSKIRDETAAILAVKKAIQLVREYGTRLYILHISTRQEIDLIAHAKEEGLPVFAETTPHHLFLNLTDYISLNGKAVMNPPLRTSEHQKALFTAIKSGVIDTIGSDHAPHTLEEKARSYGMCPSGVPGIETTLPLLLEAYHRGLLTLNNIVELTYRRAKKIFHLPDYPEDCVLVDLSLAKRVEDKHLSTKCQWSPFSGRVLRGWPVTTILKRCVYDLTKI
ncbi:dihydroorotase family protein [Rickettsiella endosymbiont of Litargus connexus]|jgi:dihydroorotase|uniref:dihydroorotase n=1 Tax=Rickettsiella endosymbiont of Litargus connexus TaxID=3066237 RepID=UPI0027EF4A73|nr:dihydroorotase [Gammaproteobacteria bacterium]MDD5161552.1 dihydroorotase [Candidatus Rickettsiella isopodorum]MDQ5900059.1 dihydroorotase [Pseudomonadota bacterium]